MSITLQKLDFLRQSWLFPRYAFPGLDAVSFEIAPKEKLGIQFEGRVFLLERNEADNAFVLNSLNHEPGTTTLTSENDTFHQKSDGVNEMWMFVDEKFISVIGAGVTIMGPNVARDVKRSKQKDEDIRAPMGGHIISTLYDPKSGHIIDGGRLYEDSKNGIKPPFIIVDFERDEELKKSYKNITSDLNNLDEKTILQRVFNEFKDLKYLHDENPLKEKLKKIKRGIRVGTLVKRLGGICCYQAYIVCAILEKLILDKHLSGKVFYGSGKDHGWPFYLSNNENVYVIDPTQKHFTNLNENPDETFCGSEKEDEKEVIKRFKYKDFLPVEITKKSELSLV